MRVCGWLAVAAFPTAVGPAQSGVLYTLVVGLSAVTMRLWVWLWAPTERRLLGTPMGLLRALQARLDGGEFDSDGDGYYIRTKDHGRVGPMSGEKIAPARLAFAHAQAHNAHGRFARSN